jgi:hypothetical protein
MNSWCFAVPPVGRSERGIATAADSQGPIGKKSLILELRNLLRCVHDF